MPKNFAAIEVFPFQGNKIVSPNHSPGEFGGGVLKNTRSGYVPFATYL